MGNTLPSASAPGTHDKKWWLMALGNEQGPFTTAQVRGGLVKHQITAATPARIDGQEERKPLSEWDEFRSSTSGQMQLHVATDKIKGAWEAGKTVADLAKDRGSKFINPFRQLSFAEEVFPLNVENAKRLARQPSFWAITGLAALPLLFATLQQQSQQLAAFAFYFAGVWGLVFRFNIVTNVNIAWKWLLASMLFTGLAGINGLVLIYRLLPDWYVQWPHSDSTIARLLGFVLQTGVCEELTKMAPVALIVLWLGVSLSYGDIIMLGVFSGLGFAAFENLAYGQKAVEGTRVMTRMAGAQGLELGVQVAMITVLMRSVSCVFGHAIYSAIFAHFIAVSRGAGIKRVPLVVAGLCVAAVIHGLYNAFWSIQTTLPIIVTVVGFMLLKVYLEQGSRLVEIVNSSELHVEAEGEAHPASVENP